MTRTIIYRYMGTNGIIESPIHLEGVPCVHLLKLTADNKKILTDGKQRLKTVTIQTKDESLWREVDA